MKNLLAKELLETAIVAAPLVVFATLLLAFVPQEVLLLAPDVSTLGNVATLAALVGGALACWSFERERMRGLEGVLVHRGTGARGAFVAKLVAGALGAWLSVSVPVASHAVIQSFGANGALVQWARVSECAIAACAAVPAFALAAWIVVLRRGWRGWLLALAAACGGIRLLVLLALAAPDAGASISSAWALGVALSTAAFTLLGRRASDERRDRDLPIAKLDLAAVLLVATCAGVVPFAAFIADVQKRFARGALLSQPNLVLESATQRVFAARNIGGAWFETDAEGRPDVARPLEGYVDAPWLPPSARASAYRPLASASRRIQSEVTSTFNEIRERAGDSLRNLCWWPIGTRERLAYTCGESRGVLERRAFFDPGSGCVRVLAFAVEGGGAPSTTVEVPCEPPFQRTFLRGDQRPFGGPFAVSVTIDGATVADFSDRTVWRVALDGVRAESTPLWFDPPDELAPYDAQFVGEPFLGPAVIGGHGGFEPRGRWLVRSAATPSTSHDLAGYRVLEVDPDPWRWAVRVERSDGSTAFEGRFERLGGAALFDTAMTSSLALLRPPIASVRSFFDPNIATRGLDGGGDPLREPLVAAGARPGLVVLHGALALVCALLALHSARRHGVAAWLAVLVALAVVALGVALYVCVLLVEPRRGRRSERRALETQGGASEAAEPVIAST